MQKEQQLSSTSYVYDKATDILSYLMTAALKETVAFMTIAFLKIRTGKNWDCKVDKI